VVSSIHLLEFKSWRFIRLRVDSLAEKEQYPKGEWEASSAAEGKFGAFKSGKIKALGLRWIREYVICP